MKHIDKEILLKHILDVLEMDKSVEVKSHLSECENCRTAFEKISGYVNTLGSYDAVVNGLTPPPLRRKTDYYIWLKRVAVLIIGFTLGYATSTYFQPEQINVVQQHLIVNAPQSTDAEFITCEIVDI